MSDTRAKLNAIAHEMRLLAIEALEHSVEAVEDAARFDQLVRLASDGESERILDKLIADGLVVDGLLVSPLKNAN